MPSNVNVFTSGWRSTGSNVSTPQFEMTVRIDWKDDAGVSHSTTQLVQFPNFFNQVPAAWAADQLQELIVKAARQKFGVDG